MAKHWEKEDRHCWQKSEVMQNFEKTLLKNYATLEAAQLKLANLADTVKQLPAAKKSVDDMAVSVNTLNKALSGAADDGAVKDCPACSGGDAVHDQSCERDDLDDHRGYILKWHPTGAGSNTDKIAQKADGAKFKYKIESGKNDSPVNPKYNEVFCLSISRDDGETYLKVKDYLFMSDALDEADKIEQESVGYSEDEVKLAKASVLSELRKMASDATDVRDMALVYQIERTIQEMLESEDDQ